MTAMSFQRSDTPGGFQVVTPEPRKVTLPAPRKLQHHEVTEINSRFRPVIDATIIRGWWIWQHEVHGVVYGIGGGWLARVAARRLG